MSRTYSTRNGRLGRERDRDRDSDDERERQRDRREDGTRGEGSRRSERDAIESDSDEEDERRDRAAELLFSQPIPSLQEFRAQEKAVESDGEDAADVAEDDPRFAWTKDNFEDVPVTWRAAGETLRTARDEYTRIGAAIQQGIEALIENGRDLETVSPDHEKMDKIQVCILDLITADKERQIRLDVVTAVIEELRRDKQMENILEVVNQRSKDEIARYRAKTLREKFKDDERFIQFRTTVWDVNHEDEPMPNVTHWLERKDGDESDDEIQVGGTLHTYKCPISLTNLVDACKSSKCGHYYSYESIINYLAHNPRRATKCPVGGCNQVLTRNDIHRDPRMQQKTDAFVQRQRRREEEADDAVELDEE